MSKNILSLKMYQILLATCIIQILITIPWFYFRVLILAEFHDVQTIEDIELMDRYNHLTQRSNSTYNLQLLINTVMTSIVVSLNIFEAFIVCIIIIREKKQTIPEIYYHQKNHGTIYHENKKFERNMLILYLLGTVGTSSYFTYYIVK